MSKPRGGCKLIIKTINDKITSYFPPSPLPEDEDVDSELDTIEEKVPQDTNITKEEEDEDTPGDIPTPDSTPTKNKSEIFPESATDTPHKIQLVTSDTPPEYDDCIGKENCSSGNTQPLSCSNGNTDNSLSRHCDSPKPTQPKLTKCDKSDPTPGRKGRKGRGRRKAAGSLQQSASQPAQAKSRPTSSTKTAPKKAPQQNHLLTDYFPIRRSARRTTSDLKKEHQAELEKAILEDCTDGLKVEEITGKGRGVVATKPFKRGEFVVEYVGDLISHGDAKDREKKYAANPEFGCYMYYFTHNNKSYCIDATAESGKLGRLLNHSCKTPNCMTKVVSINNHPYLILVAARDIETGEELIYDYGDRSKESLEAHPWLAL